MPVTPLLALCLLLLLVCSVASAALDLPLLVRNDQPLDRVGEPVASGIPLPRGAVTDPAQLRVFDAAGKAVLGQAHQLGLSWPDGSLRWALVQFPATVKAGATATYRLKTASGKPPAPAQKVAVRETADAVVVNTGTLRFSVSRRDFRLLDGLALADSKAPGRFTPVLGATKAELVADREHMTLAEFQATGRAPKDLATYGIADTGDIKWGKVQPGVDYSPFLAGPVDITVEERGPFRAVVRIAGAAEKREGEVGFVARLYAYAGKPYVRVEYTLESYEQFLDVPDEGSHKAICNSKHLRKLHLRFGLPASAERVTFGMPGGPVNLAAGGAALRQLDPGKCALTDASGQAIEGERAPGWMTVAAGGRQIGLAAKWFWETAPRGLAYDAATGEMVLELRPESAPGPGYPLAAGRQKTYEFVVGVDTSGPQLSALARAELQAYPDPEYVTGTGATHRFVPLSDPRFSKFADYVRVTREKAAAVRLHGDIDFGDQIGWNGNERWNGYHGGTHEWFMFYLASGEPELFRIAEQETWHSLDVDTQHWGYLPGCHEAEYARKHDHVCAAMYQGGIKVWCFGETDYYLLTGKRRVLESLQRTTRFLLNCGGVVNRVYTAERATSLPFLHLAYLYEALGDEGALAQGFPKAMRAGAGKHRVDTAAGELSASVLASLQDMCRHFNGVYDRGEHIQSSFLASYPAEAMHRYYLLSGDPAAAEGVLKAAKFLYNDMIVPTGIIKYAGGAPWDANSLWMPWWDGVEAPAATAYMATKDKQYLDWGKAPVDWVLNYRGYAYSSGPWSFQGAMGFGGTLSTYLWALREAGLTQDDLSTMRTDLDYAQALEACQAKCEEFRERAMGNTGESGTFCRLAGEVGRVLINQGKYEEAVTWLEPWSKAAYGVYVQPVLDRAKALREAR